MTCQYHNKSRGVLSYSFRDFVYFLFFFSCLANLLDEVVSLDDDLRGNYCRNRFPQNCCPGRDDTCTVPILGTLCYCDTFCNRTSSADCCPDFLQVCLGISPPEPIVRPECLYKGRYHPLGQSIKINCNKCTCVQKSPTVFEFSCEQKVCLVRQEMIDAINRSPYGWRATNYSEFWSETLQDAVQHYLGTFKPTRPTVEMYEIHPISNGPLPQQFDSRTRWPNLIHPVRDQGKCASSWAFSTTAVASDRLAIESMGNENVQLSTQHLLSCQRRGQRGCQGGHLDKAWYYLRKNGASTESCFPYMSGQTGHILDCPFKGRSPHWRHGASRICSDGSDPVIYKMTPPYRVGPKEDEIMREIYFNGPVQATFKVNEDFFLYREGVYKHEISLTEGLPEPFRLSGYHSVRIIGWGIDSSSGRPVKYWLCANSWGQDWGEDGYFRIIRGEDECEIEMFIVGVWAKVIQAKKTT